MTSSKPILFSLDDDKFIQDDLTELASECDWQVVSARCVDEAKENYSKVMYEVRLVIVDMMIPISQADLRFVDEIQSRRAAYVANKFPKMSDLVELSREQLNQARDELQEFDREIRSKVVFDGGMKFLEFLALQNQNHKVVVFSARRSVENPAIDTLREQNRWLGWLGKPIDPSTLTDMLKEIQNEPAARF